jgi:hypothetical protein
MKYVYFFSQPFSALVSVVSLSYLLFVKHFLKSSLLLPKANKICNVLICFFILTFVFFFFGKTRSLEKINEACTFITFIFLFVLSLYAWLKKEYKPARFFALASSVLTFSTFLLLLGLAGFDTNFKIGVFRIDNIGIMLFFALLSFALGDRINILTKEKAEAQQIALEKLEQMVEERTKEVVEKSHEIEEKNKDILASIQYAKRIQTSLITSQKYIEKTLGRLKSDT